MATFDLKSILCIDPQEPGGDELYVVFTPIDDIGLDSTFKLGGGFGETNVEREYPSPGSPDVKFSFNESMFMTLYEGDSQQPNPLADTKIGSIRISPFDTGNYSETFGGSSIMYWAEYDIF